MAGQEQLEKRLYNDWMMIVHNFLQKHKKRKLNKKFNSPALSKLDWVYPGSYDEYTLYEVRKILNALWGNCQYFTFTC